MSQPDLVTFKPIYRQKANIFSPSSDPDKPRYLDVPVLQNHFNRKKAQNDWFIRAMSEYKNSVSHFFCTLTYDQFSLPKLSDGRPGFCPEDITNFFKLVRTRLRDVFESSVEFRYFLVSEYGKHTKRPHYHVLFFFPGLLILHPFFQKLIKECWIHGFSDIAHPRSNAVLTYCSKYVSKDMYADPDSHAYTDPNISEYQEHRRVHAPEMMRFPSWHPPLMPSKERPSTVTLYNFHRQSLGFGSSLIDTITEDEWKRGYITYGDGVRVFRYRIPKYVVDKVCRQTVYWRGADGQRHSKTSKTEFGAQVFEWRVEHNSCYILSKAREYSDPSFVSKLEKMGLDIYCPALDPKIAQEMNDMKFCEDLHTDFHYYLRYRRNFIYKDLLPAKVNCRKLGNPFGNKIKYLTREQFYFTSEEGIAGEIRKTLPDGKPIDYRPFLYNTKYRGYESLLHAVNEIDEFLARHKQRYEEREEWKKIKERLRSGFI